MGLRSCAHQKLLKANISVTVTLSHESGHLNELRPKSLCYPSIHNKSRCLGVTSDSVNIIPYRINKPNR